MDRMEMLEAARQEAFEAIRESSCLSDERFDQFKKSGGEGAVRLLAKEFLQEVLDNFEERSWHA